MGEYLEERSVADRTAFIDDYDIELIRCVPFTPHMLRDCAEVCVGSVDAALQVVDGWVGVCQEELPLTLEVVSDVVDHRGLAGSCGSVDEGHLRVGEKLPQGLSLDLMVNLLWITIRELRVLVKPCGDIVRVVLDAVRCDFLELLDDLYRVVLVPGDEHVAVGALEFAWGMSWCRWKSGVVAPNQVVDVPEVFEVAFGCVDHAVLLDVVAYASRK